MILYRLEYFFLMEDVFPTHFVKTDIGQLKSPRTKILLVILQRIGSRILPKINLLVLVIRSVDVNRTQLVFIDVYVRDKKTAVFICSGFQETA